MNVGAFVPCGAGAAGALSRGPSAGSAAACTLAAGAIFAATQNLPFTTSLCWAITTATTVGYGDVTPHNASGRVVASLTMLTTIPMLASVSRW